MFPGFDHAVLPTPVKLVPAPASLGPLVCPVMSAHEEVTDKDPEPPAQIETSVVERTDCITAVVMLFPLAVALV